MSIETIESQVVHLESLYKAYGQILEDAKAQLENLQLNASTVERLTTELKGDYVFRGEVAAEVCRLLRDDLKSMDEKVWDHYSTSSLIAAIAEKIVAMAKPQIKQLITDTLVTEVESAGLARKLEQKVLENDSINSALKVQQALASILKTK